MRLLAGALIVLVAGALARTVNAYPQFQLSTGASRCSQCHVSPAGGGLLNSHGRDSLTETIARAGDGAFLHGTWEPPAWLVLGGDFRGAAGAVRDGSDASPEALVFPMQADGYAQARLGPLSAVLAVGFRGSARGRTTQVLDRVGSREHYLMWRPASQGPFVRAGGFMLPYGLRLAEHPSYTRRFGGSGYEEEPLALSGGFATNEHELHLTAFTAAPVRCTGLGCARAGAAVLYERRLAERTALGVQARAATLPPEMGFHQVGGGATGKHAFERLPLLLMAELDYDARTFREAGYTGHQLIGLVGATFFATRGLMVTAIGEAFAEDLRARRATRTAGSLELQLFPWAHVELVVYGRVTDRRSADALLILHYTL
jgi:hypothetical protein